LAGVSWLDDPASLAALLGPILTALAAILLWVWRQGKKVGKTQDTISDLKKEVSKIEGMEKRLTIIETRFEPFLKVLEDSLSRMIIGDAKGNPLDPALLRKVKMGLASAEEIDAFDGMLVKEIEQKGPEALSFVVVRSWLALKRAEVMGAALLGKV